MSKEKEEINNIKENYNKLLKKYNKKVQENKDLKELIYKFGIKTIKQAIK